eukprot:scpid42000/ scgid5248/ 
MARSFPVPGCNIACVCSHGAAWSKLLHLLPRATMFAWESSCSSVRLARRCQPVCYCVRRHAQSAYQLHKWFPKSHGCSGFHQRPCIDLSADQDFDRHCSTCSAMSISMAYLPASTPFLTCQFPVFSSGAPTEPSFVLFQYF